MFGMKKPEEDPQKALDNARNSLNKGISGGLTKAFMGKDFVNKMNATMDQGQAALDGVQQQQWLMQNGADGTAVVASVTDTGQTVNMNPVVVVQMKVTPASGAPFDAVAQTMVSRIAVPRAGDTVKVKYNPDNLMQIAIVS
ncbi:MAG TPA: hypothetical protein VMC62_03965 [Longilinea sp.]|nr:hypothetical protein [Longilinea sp.]